MTPIDQPKPQRKRRKWPFVVGGVLVIGFIGALMSDDEDVPDDDAAAAVVETDEPIADPEEEVTEEEEAEPEEEATEEATEEEAEEEAEPEPDRFTITHDDYDLDGLIPGGVTTVEFDIADNFTSGMISSGAQRATFEAIELALEEHPDTGRVAIEGSFPTVDAYGEQSDSIILRPFYDRETIDRINFDNQYAIDIWAISDGGMVHPDLLD